MFISLVRVVGSPKPAASTHATEMSSRHSTNAK